jgi:hypothetical protein
MRNIMRRVIMVVTLAAVSGVTTGCGYAIRESLLSKAHTYADTKASWGGIPDGYSRVIILCPGDAVRDSISMLKNPWVHIDDTKGWGAVGPTTFIFVDLPAGKHSINDVSTNSKPVEFSVVPNDITYVKFDRDFKLISKEEAEPLLMKMRHNYKKPLPFDKQSNSDRICF